MPRSNVSAVSPDSRHTVELAACRCLRSLMPALAARLPPCSYGAIAGECVQCEVAEPNCASCDGDAALCSACNEGYGLTNSGCQACAVENCASCDGDAAVCQSCKYGHGLVDGSCQACTVEKCANCDGNTGVCLK